MTQNSLNRHSFILRFWREDENQEWKGMVQHANSGATTPIHSLEDLLAFIERQNDELMPRLVQVQKTSADSNLK